MREAPSRYRRLVKLVLGGLVWNSNMGKIRRIDEKRGIKKGKKKINILT